MADSDTDYIRVFIDTKSSDFIDTRLLSVALAAPDGAEFYAELDGYPDNASNDFVRANILPSSGRTPSALMSKNELQNQLLAWLTEVRGNKTKLIISYELFGDWISLVEALGNTVPEWLQSDDVRSNVDEAIRRQFFEITQMPREHAIWSARALRSAYRGQDN